MDRYTLLDVLPPSRDEWVKVADDQSVPDIIRGILSAHERNRPLYDKIALYFDGGSLDQIAQNIFDFEAENISYREESQDHQTTTVPQGFLERGYGDCKHFSSFAAGVLDGLNRLKGYGLDWCYRFVSYKLLQTEPYHVFVVIKEPSREVWIDATPGAEGKRPVWIDDRKPKNSGAAIMGLYNQIAGTGEGESVLITDSGESVPAESVGPIGLLQSYGVLSPAGEFNQARYNFLTLTLGSTRKALLHSAVQSLMSGASVSGWLSDAFKGVQHFAAGMGMQVPRAAFLGLVSLNAFGYANKLSRALQFTDTREKLEDIWWRLGGAPDKLRQAIEIGRTKPIATQVQGTSGSIVDLALNKPANDITTIHIGGAVGGQLRALVNGRGAKIGFEAVTASVIASAAIIVAAVMPVISKMLDHNHPTTVVETLPLDPSTGLPAGYSSNPVIDFLKTNPFLVIAVLGAMGYYLYKNY